VNKRIAEENVFKLLMILSIAIVIGSLVLIITTIFMNGALSLSFEMISQTSSGGYYLGRSGGILNAILGSIFLALPATGLAYLIGLGIALYLQRDFLHPKIASLIRFSLDILWGIPSIIYGVFGLMIMVALGIGASLLAGIFALTLLEIPIITRSIDECIKMVPAGLKEGSYSLGSTSFETAFKVIRRQAMPSIIAGVLLGLGRGIGDAASILFTAGFSDSIPTSLMDSTAALPTMIYHLYSSPIPAVREKAYAAAFILIVIVTTISVISRCMIKRCRKFVIK
jgi:phosphate transport system permease protein